ncbi:hypothetical protein BGZ79_001042 [Entomortierella chlamydospora]|nr:hypothetical protein BGZ79_001042 [Entomortierella chlamydospora]
MDESSVIDSPSLRKRRDMISPHLGRPSQSIYSIPSTTSLKSPGAAYRTHMQQQQQQQQQNQEQSIFYNAPPNDHDTLISNASSSFRAPTFLDRRTKSSSSLSTHPASSIHRQQASEMADSLAKLLENNDRSRNEVSRQARSSLTAATKSLEALRQSQRRSLDSVSADRIARASVNSLLRTTETEYDVSPTITARPSTIPPLASSIASSPRYRVRNQQEESGAEEQSTLEWLQKTADASRIEEQDQYNDTEPGFSTVDQHDSYDHVASIADELRDANRDESHYQSSRHSYQPETSHETNYSDSRQEFHSHPQGRRSLTRDEDAYSQKENIPMEALSHINYSSRSPRYHDIALEQRTPDRNHVVQAAEDSLLEVAESTTTITNQLRGVYTNLQDFFSPETEAKLSGAISAIGSQKANRIAKGLSSSTTKPRPLNFRSASVRRDLKKPSSAPISTKPLTEHVPFNFSDRLNQLQKRQALRQSQISIGGTAKSDRRPLGTHKPSAQQQFQEQLSELESETNEAAPALRESTPIIRNRIVNEYQEMSKSPFIPLTQRKIQLEKRGPIVASKPHTTTGAAALPRRPLTEPKSPVLHTRTRVKSTPIPQEDQSLQASAHHGGYKAHKVNRRILESSGDLGVPKITKPALTVPKSPVFTKRKHAPLRPAIMPTKTPTQLQNYRKFQPSITQHGLVSSAESARRLSGEKLSGEKLSGETLKRSVRRDQATSHLETNPPQAIKPALTVPEPFKLETESRGARYQEQFQHKLERWRQIEKEQQFKALPLPVYPELFVPKKSTKPLTHTVPVHLWTDKRAEHWDEIEQERKRKEKLFQEALAQKAREDELREQQELKELRRRLVPHPTPIRDYPRIEIHKSARALTVPRSPNIGEKRKRQMTLERELSISHEEHSQGNSHNHHQRQSEVASSSEQVEQVYEDPEYERERLRENERAQGEEYELRRLSSYSNSRGSEDRQRQDLIREEIERQREKDAQDRQTIEIKHLQQQQQQQRNSQSYERTEIGYRDENEMEQNKRRRLFEEAQPQPVFGRRMGRKSWLEANDL